jgi:hypothetical protein
MFIVAGPAALFGIEMVLAGCPRQNLTGASDFEALGV